MAELERTTAPASVPAADPIAGLHKMSTTAGVGSSDYVEINTLAIVSAVLALVTGFSLFDELFLLAGVAAIVVGVIALRQIAQSNGTQGGRALAAIGILLSLGIGATVVARTLAARAAVRKDQDAVNALIADLGEAIKKGKYLEAYNKFDKEFQAYISPQQFENTWRGVQDPTAGGAPLAEMKGNDIFEFGQLPTGERTAITKAIIKFDRQGPNEGRLRVDARKPPGQDWKLAHLPELMDRRSSPLGQRPQQ
jgi:hypothetical protein